MCHCAQFGTGVEEAVRLTNTAAGVTADVESGILEIFHAGAWGTLCLNRKRRIEVCCSRCIMIATACAVVRLPGEASRST